MGTWQCLRPLYADDVLAPRVKSRSGRLIAKRVRLLGLAREQKLVERAQWPFWIGRLLASVAVPSEPEARVLLVVFLATVATATVALMGRLGQHLGWIHGDSGCVYAWAVCVYDLKEVSAEQFIPQQHSCGQRDWQGGWIKMRRWRLRLLLLHMHMAAGGRRSSIYTCGCIETIHLGGGTTLFPSDF